MSGGGRTVSLQYLVQMHNSTNRQRDAQAWPVNPSHVDSGIMIMIIAFDPILRHLIKGSPRLPRKSKLGARCELEMFEHFCRLALLLYY
jgi:hypothetical protein